MLTPNGESFPAGDPLSGVWAEHHTLDPRVLRREISGRPPPVLPCGDEKSAGRCLYCGDMSVFVSITDFIEKTFFPFSNLQCIRETPPPASILFSARGGAEGSGCAVAACGVCPTRCRNPIGVDRASASSCTAAAWDPFHPPA